MGKYAENIEEANGDVCNVIIFDMDSIIYISFP